MEEQIISKKNDMNNNIDIFLCGDNIHIKNILQKLNTNDKYKKTYIDDSESYLFHLESILKNILESRNSHYKIYTDYFIRETQYQDLIMLWTPQRKSKESDKLVWRIEEDIGKNILLNNDNTIDEEKHQKTIKIPNPSDFNNEYYVLFNDQNFGLFDEDNLDKLLKFLENQNCKSILLKTLFFKEQVNFINSLLNRTDIAKKLNIILNIDILRRIGIEIDKNIPWDRLLFKMISKIIEKELKPRFGDLKKLTIYFKGAGVLVLDSLNIDTLSLFYDPRETENSWYLNRPGKIHGDLDIIASSLLLTDTNKDITQQEALKIALTIIREKHMEGRGEYKGEEESRKWGYNQNRELEIIKNHFKSRNIVESEKYNFYSTIPYSQYLLKNSKQNISYSIFESLIGSSYEKIIQKGLQIIVNGHKNELKGLPFIKYDKYITYDFREINDLNKIETLLIDYIKQEKDRHPIAFTVFGSPGTGKSFVIQELAKHISSDRFEILQYNLSQLPEKRFIIPIFHAIRDVSIKKRIPLVIFDEFDTDKLSWLKMFLSPIQDAEFSDRGDTFSFGKSVFFFCGSCYSSFEEFSSKILHDQSIDKGSDFLSRISAYLNVMGINQEKSIISTENIQKYNDPFSNYLYIIRRAVVLRSLIEKNWSNLINIDTKKANISLSIIQGFLRADEFYFGIRSMETILKISNIKESNDFGKSELPPVHFIRPNVSDDFLQYVNSNKIDNSIIDELTDSCLLQFYEIQKVKELSYQQRLPFYRFSLQFISNLLDFGFNISKQKDKYFEKKEHLFDIKFDNQIHLDDLVNYLKNKLYILYKEYCLDENTILDLRINEQEKHFFDQNREQYLKVVDRYFEVLKNNNLQISFGYRLGYSIKIGFIGLQDFKYNETKVKKVLEFVFNHYDFHNIYIYLCKKVEKDNKNIENIEKLIQGIEKWFIGRNIEPKSYEIFQSDFKCLKCNIHVGNGNLKKCNNLLNIYDVVIPLTKESEKIFNENFSMLETNNPKENLNTIMNNLVKNDKKDTAFLKTMMNKYYNIKL